MLPKNVITALKKNIESTLYIQESKRSQLEWVDLYRFLDHCILLYLRFNDEHNIHPLLKMFHAWTLFSTDYLELDLVYMTLRILMPTDHEKIISYYYPKTQEVINKKSKGII